SWLPERVANNVRRALVSQGGEDAQGILVSAISAITDPNCPSEYVFMPEMAGWVLPAKYPEEVELARMRQEALKEQSVTSISGEIREEGGVILGRVVLLLEELCISGSAGMPKEKFEQMVDGLSRDIGQEAGAVLEFIEACSCSNVHHQVVQQAPKAAVAQRRARDGKLPILETRALVLDLPGKESSGMAGANGDSGRASPRQHLRRGHIRRLESGKRVWVQSAVVGGERAGVIDKAYVIRPRG